MIEIGPNLSSALIGIAGCLTTAVFFWAVFRD